MSMLSFALALLLLGAPNPVLPGVADSGVFRHAGRYCLMGTGTAGKMYVSTDLMHWAEPVHVFSMDNAWATGESGTDRQIHACDIMLHNGLFHLYWSVNHGPLRQIGHAIAEAPLGPYREPVRDRPFDGRIDPQCFQDDDGRLYLYTVKFDAGNVIWGQPMAGPGALIGEPKRLLWALRNDWEMLDRPQGEPVFAINEGPFVVKYRGRYYMIYNANHTAARYGHYALGVAEAETPLGFDNAGKYGFPILRSNRDAKYAGGPSADAPPEIKNCGQPNLVRGPNGIAWWLVYFADYPRRAQAIDRVHFFGRELFAEGPTCAASPGWHPVPAMPGFQDLFEDDVDPATRWDLSGEWRQANGELHAPDTPGPAEAFARMRPAENYILEAVLRHRGGDAGRLGVIARGTEKCAALRIGFDRAAKAWFCEAPDQARRAVPLPSGFNWNGPHTLRVEVNAGGLAALLDGVALDLAGAGIAEGFPVSAGLFAEDCDAAFDSFMRTRGWDEWGGGIRGWRDASGQAKSAGPGGLRLDAGECCFKGARLPQYEFAAQLRADGCGGIYALFADEANWLRAAADAAFRELRVTGKRGGEVLPETVFPIPERIHRACDASVNGNNLRAVKLGDRVILFAEGAELGSIQGPWPDARPGLFAGNGPCIFDALTCFERP